MIRVRWDHNEKVHIGTVIGVVNDAGDTLAVVADDEGPIVEIGIQRLFNASASPVGHRQITASGVTL